MDIKELNLIKDVIINDYNHGASIKDLSAKYETTWTNIYGIVSSTYKHSINLLSDTDKSDIKQLYLSGLSCTKIAEKYKIHHKTINKVLEEYGIKRTGKSVRKYTLNENYFDKIDTPNKAYILGLLYADGYNSISKGTICLSLQDIDKAILEKINIEIDSNRPLEFINNDKIASNGYKSRNMYKLNISSIHMCRALETIGMVQNKSLVLTFPDIDKQLYSHFIRGYFDGDGSYCCHYLNNGSNSRNDLVTITSTKAMCESILSILHEENIVGGGGIYDASNHNNITKVLSISGKVQCYNFLSWLYQDAQLYIERKYNNYKLNLL